LSELARWILLHTGDGTDRGQIAEGFFKLERLYCGWYVDPCYNPKVRRERDSKYKKAQPLITKTLWRLQRLRLVELIKHGKCVKKIRLTAAGKAVVQQLVEDGDIETDKCPEQPTGQTGSFEIAVGLPPIMGTLGKRSTLKRCAGFRPGFVTGVIDTSAVQQLASM
jgi:hypothetical protein